MRKFNDVYKEKQNKALNLLEGRILNEFKSVYSTLLEKYNIADFYQLNEEEQTTFLSELNSCWNEQEGLLEKGKKFLQTRSDVLSENSTSLQKKNYLKNKSISIISETIRQSDLKWKIYDVIDEIYKETKAKTINDVLSPTNISDIVKEAFQQSLNNLDLEIRNELNESSKEKKDPDAEIRNRGNVIFSAENKKVKDDKDHFPINNINQARNAWSRVNQYSKAPSWYEGSLTEMKEKVKSCVKKKYPSIKFS